MLTIQHLTKRYGEKKAVDDLSLHIAPGEIYGFIGHNGAGKTTTLKSVVGILQFDEGEITIDGHSVKADPLTCKRELAYIPDNPDLYDFMTGIKYLNFVADIFGVGAVHGEEIHRAAAVGAELPEDDPSVRFKKPDVAVVKLGAPPEIRRAALFDPRRERIVRDRNGKIGVRALRHGDGVPEHALTAFRLFLLSAYRFRTERSRRQKKEKAKVALSVADGGIVW